MYTTKQIRQFHAARNDAKDDALFDAIYESTLEMERIERALRSEIASAQRSLTEALSNLDRGYQVGSLGILQSTGGNVDRLAGELNVATKWAAAMQHHARKSNLIPEEAETK